MTGTVMRLEWRNLLAERTPLLAALLLGLMICYAAYNGAAWVRFQKQTIAAARAEERQRLGEIRQGIGLANRGEKAYTQWVDPRNPGPIGRTLGTRHAIMPPGSLAPLAVGQSDLYPSYFRVSTQSKQTFLTSDEIENPVHLLAGRFDLAFVIIYLLPLVILAFSYNIVSAEKEAGTLAMAMSQPVALRKVVLAKAGVRAVFLLGLVSVLALAGVVIGGAELSSPDAWPRLAMWLGVTALYGAFWFALAVAVNALGRSSATNAIALFGLWLMFVVLVPSLLSVAVQTFYPVPTRVEMIQAMRVAGDEASRQGSVLLAKYVEDHPEMSGAAESAAGFSDFYALNYVVSDSVERKVQPILDHFDAQIASQQAFVDRFRFLSPAVVAQAAFNDLAGASAHRYRHFLTQADRYHRTWRDFFIPLTVRRVALTEQHVDAFPTFRFEEEPIQQVAARVAADLGGLALPMLLVTLPAAAWLRRYRIAG